MKLKDFLVVSSVLVLDVLRCRTVRPVVVADPEERKVTLENLHMEFLYEAFMTVSTFGGSLNGSTVHFKTEPFGWYQSGNYFLYKGSDQTVYLSNKI